MTINATDDLAASIANVLADGYVLGSAALRKGPLIWRDMDQIELDAAYDQAAYAPTKSQSMARLAANSAIARERVGAPQRFSCGSGKEEGIDVFVSRKQGAPVFLFVHGGGWLSGTAEDYAFPAEHLREIGAIYVVLDFAPIESHCGDLQRMIEQVARAIAWTYSNIEMLGGDQDCLFVGGHSSGAHLLSAALLTDGATSSVYLKASFVAHCA